MPKSTRFVIAALAGLLLVGGCKSEQEKAASDMIDVISDYADILEGIKSEKDIKDKSSELAEIGKRMNAQQAVVKSMKKPSDAEDKALRDKYKPQLEKQGQRIRTQMDRIARDLGPGATMEIVVKTGKGGAAGF